MTNCKDVPNYKLRSPAVVSERLKTRSSGARAALQELLRKGWISVKAQSSSHLHQKHQRWGCPSCWGRCRNDRSHQLYILKNETLLNLKKKKIH